MTRAATFWDRRRAAVQAEEVASQQKVGAEADVLQAAEQAEKTDTELLAEFNLPDPDTLKAGDDFSVFMAKSVPTHLRQRALRKLWVSNPVLACLDDLVDYADDYTQTSARTCFETSYQVGKGLRRHVEEVMRANAATEVDEMAESAEIELVEADNGEAPDVATESPDEEVPPTTDVHVQADRPARRMAFHFEELSA